MRVLVIDDEKGIRDILRDFLGVLGHDAEVAGDGISGLARFAEGRYDLVLTDLVMPGMSGLAVAQTIRQEHPDMRIIVITGSGDHFDLQRLEEFNLGHLQKPVSFADFKRAVGSESGALGLTGRTNHS